MDYNYDLIPAEEETLAVFEEPEVITAVVLKKCPVVSYNPYNKIIVYKRDGILVQSNCIDYDGSGYVEVE